MKTEVYSWRLSPEKKAELEGEARQEGTSLAQLLDQITADWLNQRHNGQSADAAEQASIRRRAAAAIGSVASGDPLRSSQASQRVKSILRKRYGRTRTD
jgi:hypothetical protein